MNDALNNHVGSVNISGKIITNLRFADYIDGQHVNVHVEWK